MRAAVSGVGLWVPDEVRTNDAWPAEDGDVAPSARALAAAPVAQGDGIDAICARYTLAERGDRFLGATERRVVSAAVSSAEAEAKAAERALEDAGVSGAEVDAILS